MVKKCVKCGRKIRFLEFHNEDDKGNPVCINCSITENQKDTKKTKTKDAHTNYVANRTEENRTMSLTKQKKPWYHSWLIRVLALIMGLIVAYYWVKDISVMFRN